MTCTDHQHDNSLAGERSFLYGPSTGNIVSIIILHVGRSTCRKQGYLHGQCIFQARCFKYSSSCNSSMESLSVCPSFCLSIGPKFLPTVVSLDLKAGVVIRINVYDI